MLLEYGALAVAAQRSRRSEEDRIANAPADGMVTGIRLVNRLIFGAERARAVVMAYDATVLAGTQGMRNHAKTDRLLDIALAQKLPVVLLAEGGGGLWARRVPARRHWPFHRAARPRCADVLVDNKPQAVVAARRYLSSFQGRLLMLRTSLQHGAAQGLRPGAFSRWCSPWPGPAASSAQQMATTLEIDAVIDPAQTREWLARGLASARVAGPAGPRFIDTW